MASKAHRFFVDRLADKVFVYQPDGSLRLYAGGYSYYKEKEREEEAARRKKEKEEEEARKKKEKAAERRKAQIERTLISTGGQILKRGLLKTLFK